MTLSEVKNLFLTLKNLRSTTVPSGKEKGKDFDKEFCILANGF
jgi:hypothetical protein